MWMSGPMFFRSPSHFLRVLAYKRMKLRLLEGEFGGGKEGVLLTARREAPRVYPRAQLSFWKGKRLKIKRSLSISSSI